MEDDAIAGALLTMVRGLVDQPDSVVVTPYADDEGTSYEVRVGPGDMGKVIGRQGRVAGALRLYARAIAQKSHRRVQVEFAD